MPSIALPFEHKTMNFLSPLPSPNSRFVCSTYAEKRSMTKSCMKQKGEGLKNFHLLVIKQVLFSSCLATTGGCLY